MADVLGEDARPDRPGARRRRRAGAVLLVGLVVLALLDTAARRREVGALLDRAAAGQSAAGYADRRLAGTVQYVSPQLASPSAPPAVRADLRRLVQGEAAGQVPVLRRRRDAAAGTPVLPWHRAGRRARSAYVAHLDARLERLRAVARDVDALYLPRPGVGATEREARARLADAGAPAGRLDEVFGAARVRAAGAPCCPAPPGRPAA